MNKVRITAIRKASYPDLMAKYENPIEHTCDVVDTYSGAYPPSLRRPKSSVTN